jgi:uncharacterized membrane protein YgcG
MFEGDWDELDAAATLDAAVEFDEEENRAALGKLEAVLHFADLHADLPIRSQHAPTMRGGERLVVYGGEGCPAVAEFAPAELGPLLKLATRTAAGYLGEALALRHRFPKILAKTRNGQAIVWRARAVARACINLSQEAAALVDERVVPVIDTLSAYRLQKIIDAVIKQVDPEAARKAAEDRARDRGVWVHPSDDHGTKTIYVKAAAGDVIRFEATINDLAHALAALGDPGTLAARRAKAIGWIADPAAAYELLAAARYLATHPTETTATTPDTAGAAGATGAAGPAGAAGAAGAARPAGAAGPAGGARPAGGAGPAGAAKADGEDTTEASNQTSTTPDLDARLVDTADGRDPDTIDDLPEAPDCGNRSAGHCDDGLPTGLDIGDRGTGGGGTVGSTGGSTGGGGTGGGGGAGGGDLPAVHDTSRCEGDVTQRNPVGVCDPGDSGAVPRERFAMDEPGLDEEADRDAPHPSQRDHLDYLEELTTAQLQDRMLRLAWKSGRRDDFSDPTRITTHGASTDDEIDPFSRQGLTQRLAEIKQTAYTTGLGHGPGNGRGRVVIYVHLTDQTLQTGQGVVRVEGHGPLLADQLHELLGHDQVIVKPVIDLKDHVSVNAYEIPTRIRERVKLTHPAELFPYSTTETTVHTDLDHIQPYDPNGPPGQTSTATLAPAARFHHRLKTHGDWQVQRLDDGALEWTTPNGYKFRVDHTGTHRITD